MSLSGVDLNLLLVLHQVLERGSVHAAASALHVTPPAVSNSLARLRVLFGDPLLVRRGRRLEETPLARSLRPTLWRAIELLQTVVDTSSTDPSRTSRTFTIAAADNVAIDLLPRLLGHFADALPRAALNVVSMDAAIASAGLESGAVDVLIGLPPAGLGLLTAPAYRERLVCAGSRVTWKGTTDLALDRFMAARHVAVMVHGGAHPIDLIDAELAVRGMVRDRVLAVPQFSMAAACVAGTPHLTMLPSRMAAALAPAFDLVFWPPPIELPTIQLLQAWHPRSHHDAACRRLRAAISVAWGDVEGVDPP